MPFLSGCVLLYYFCRFFYKTVDQTELELRLACKYEESKNMLHMHMIDHAVKYQKVIEKHMYPVCHFFVFLCFVK